MPYIQVSMSPAPYMGPLHWPPIQDRTVLHWPPIQDRTVIHWPPIQDRTVIHWPPILGSTATPARSLLGGKVIVVVEMACDEHHPLVASSCNPIPHQLWSLVPTGVKLAQL